MNYTLLDIDKIKDTTGIYMFKDKYKNILYIGRATSLKKRVKSYFISDILKTRGEIINKAIDKTKIIETIQTNSVLDSILIEAKLINKHKPLYNTKLKGGKSFYYIVITNEKFPAVLIKKERELVNTDNIETFGPFISYTIVYQILKSIRKIIPFKDKCKQNQSKECFYSQLGLCPGVCCGGISEVEYMKNISNIRLFLFGDKLKLIKILTKQIKEYVGRSEFEEAALVQNQIYSLESISDMLFIKNDLSDEKDLFIEGYDISHFSGKHTIGVIVVFNNGTFDSKLYRVFEIDEQISGDVASLQFIIEKRFAYGDMQYPDLIVIDGGKQQLNGCKKKLEELGFQIPIVSVLKDEKHHPKQILGDSNFVNKYEKQILKVNFESHFYAIRHMRKKHTKLFI